MCFRLLLMWIKSGKCINRGTLLQMVPHKYPPSPKLCIFCMSLLVNTPRSDQIKSNHFYCHITTAQVPWWVKFLWACSRQCKKTTDNLPMDRQCKKTTNNLPMDRQCKKTTNNLPMDRQCKKTTNNLPMDRQCKKKNSNLHMDRQC